MDMIFDPHGLGLAVVQRLDLHVSARPASVVSGAREVQAFEHSARGTPVLAAAREGEALLARARAAGSHEARLLLERR